MEYKYAIRRTAFLNAISQFDLSNLPDSLQLKINNLLQALDGEVNENTINLLDSVVEQCLPLKELYNKKRLALKSQETETERSKGFEVRSDNPKPESLSANNSNPPAPEKGTSNSQKNQPPKTNNN